MWSNFFRDGGWGMYPVTAFGLLLVATAFLCAFRPERRFARVAAAFGAATVSAGLLGTAIGLITTFRYVQGVAPGQQLAIAALGCAESLNNLVLALILAVLASLLGAVAAARAALRERPAAV